ncbi:uncharacterized protein AruCF_2795 [Achromobacter ruhlandii]|nr:uncharacterized protein AruCF_2795 [Achromobacter ruhlandii]
MINWPLPERAPASVRSCEPRTDRLSFSTNWLPRLTAAPASSAVALCTTALPVPRALLAPATMAPPLSVAPPKVLPALSVRVPLPVLTSEPPAPDRAPLSVRLLPPAMVSALLKANVLESAMLLARLDRVTAPLTVTPPLPRAVLLPTFTLPPLRVAPPPNVLAPLSVSAPAPLLTSEPPAPLSRPFRVRSLAPFSVSVLFSTMAFCSAIEAVEARLAAPFTVSAPLPSALLLPTIRPPALIWVAAWLLAPLRVSMPAPFLTSVPAPVRLPVNARLPVLARASVPPRPMLLPMLVAPTACSVAAP